MKRRQNPNGYPNRSHPGPRPHLRKPPELKSVIIAGSIPFDLAAWFHSHNAKSALLRRALERERQRELQRS